MTKSVSEAANEGEDAFVPAKWRLSTVLKRKVATESANVATHVEVLTTRNHRHLNG